MTKKQFYIILSIFLILLLSIFLAIDGCNKAKRQVKIQANNYDALKAQLQVKYQKDSSKVYTMLAIEGETIKDLIGIKDSSIEELQAAVKKYKNDLKSATIFKSRTNISTGNPTIFRYDTTMYTIVEDTDCAKAVIFESDIHLGLMIDRKTGKKTGNYWINGHTIATFKETKVDLQINNEYSLLIGRDKKTNRPYGEITTFNPFDTISKVKIYDITLPKERKWGIDIVAGYGIMATSDGRFVHGISGTIGIGRRLITLGRKK